MAGRTVLVTGASGGIGWELAKLFAHDGFDVAIVGRYPARLEELAQELEERFGVTAYVISKDLAGDEAPREVVWSLAEHGARADVLVNGAGFAQVGSFAEVGPHRMLELMHVNMLAATTLTRLLLPGMIERRWGRIVNLASNPAHRSGPSMAVYEATKAYVLSLSLALAEELKGTGVLVTALCPGPTATDVQVAGGLEDPALAVTGGNPASPAEAAEWGYEQVRRGKLYAVQGARLRALALGPRLVPRASAARLARRARRRSGG
jgi:short-subunit dehydrogenase